MIVEKIIGLEPSFFLWSGAVLFIAIVFLSWFIFKYSPVVLKTTLGFVLFSLLTLSSALWIGVFMVKKFVSEWLEYETSRLKEGAYVIIERRKSVHRSVIERFKKEPEKILEDRFSRTIFDFIAVADRNGEVEKSNKNALRKVPVPEVSSVHKFLKGEDGVYLVSSSWNDDKEKIISVGENVELRLSPALLDMLSAKDVYVKEVKNGKKSEDVKDKALVELGGNLVLVIEPNEEDITNMLESLLSGSARGIAVSVILAVLFFGYLSLAYIRRPLTHLISASSEVEKGNFEYEITFPAKGDIGILIRTFNNMIKGLRRRDAQIKYRNELLGSLREFGRVVLSEFDKERIYQLCVDVVGYKTNSKCAVFYDDKVKFSEKPSVKKVEIWDIPDGEIVEKEGRYILVYDIVVSREGGDKIMYGKFVAERDKNFIPEEKEFFNSLLSYVSSACQRSDYVAKLRLLQSTDSVTGLFNSTFFKASVKRELSFLKRFERHFSVVFVEIENSKEIIEKFGYIIWEDIVKAIAIIMKKSVRAYDVPARLAEDKFALLLPNTESKNAKVVEERVRNQTLSAPEIPALPELELKVKVESTGTDTEGPDSIVKKIEEKTGKIEEG